MKRRILVVDDDPDIFEVLQDLFGSDGQEVLWAKNSREFEEFAFQKPDLIILDILLGEVEDGPTIYGKLLSKGLSRDIPVIFLSALASDLPVSRLHPGRNYAMHAKPFKSNDLLRDVHMLMAA